MAVIAALSLLGTGYSIKQQKKGAKIAKESAAERAAFARQQASFSLDQLIKRTEKTLAAQEVAYAVSGVTSEGTPQVVRKDTQRQSELEAMAIVYGGEMGADTAYFEGRISSAASRSSQVSTLLGGVGAAVSMYTPSAGGAAPLTYTTDYSIPGEYSDG